MARAQRGVAGWEKKSDTPQREYKSVSFVLESADENTGEFSGYAAVFGNVDGGGDIIEKGAFTRTIAEDFARIKILSQHNSYDLPIGKPLELREDEKGLYIRGKISDTQTGRDIRTLLKDGVLCELSIGYDALDFEIDAAGIRHLKEIKLWEVSIVTWAMNDQAKIDDVKSLVEELRTEAKTGKISRRRMDALKPFIAVVKELLEILSFMDTPDADPPPAEPDAPPDPPAKPKKNADQKKQTKNAGIIFEIVPNTNRR